MLNFKQFMAEIIDKAFKTQKVLTNPSKGQVDHALKHSEHGELRYVHNLKTGHTHVADAAHFIHQEIADHAGEHEFKRDWHGEPTAYNQDHFHAGHIDKHNIHRIKAHPGGLRGHIRDVHRHMPNVRDFEN